MRKPGAAVVVGVFGGKGTMHGPLPRCLLATIADSAR
jgi:hypothetical protein